FQAEDGIRDRNVTGVQTCALPISIQNLPELTLVGYIYTVARIAYRVDESQSFVSFAGKENLGVHTHLLPRVYQFINVAGERTCMQDVDGTSKLPHKAAACGGIRR